MLPHIVLKNKRRVIQLIFLLWSEIGTPRPALEVNPPISLKSFQQYHLPKWGYSTIQCWTIVPLLLLISSLILCFCKIKPTATFPVSFNWQNNSFYCGFCNGFFIYLKMVFVLTRNNRFFSVLLYGLHSAILQSCSFLLCYFVLLLNLLFRAELSGLLLT